MQRTEFSKVYQKVKHPAKVVIAVVKDKSGKPNLITLEWFMRTSIQPPMFAISVGHTRYSYECLQDFRYFNLCIPSAEMNKIALLSGTKSGRDVNKLALSEEKYFAGKLVKLPVLQNAAANFECKIVTQVRSGDHTIFVGEVVHSWCGDGKKILLSGNLSG